MPSLDKSFSPACERNKAPLPDVLRERFAAALPLDQPPA